jgi:single-stranded DNA-binding protein
MFEAAIVGAMVSEAVEVKTSQTGKKWAAFKVAVGEGDNRQYARISVFGGLAERLAGELKKGDRVYVEAHSVRLNEYTNRDGEKRSGIQMIASRVEKAGAGAIGRNRIRKPKAPRGNDEGGTNGQGNEVARDWQRPLDDQIPF